MARKRAQRRLSKELRETLHELLDAYLPLSPPCTFRYSSTGRDTVEIYGPVDTSCAFFGTVWVGRQDSILSTLRPPNILALGDTIQPWRGETHLQAAGRYFTTKALVTRGYPNTPGIPPYMAAAIRYLTRTDREVATAPIRDVARLLEVHDPTVLAPILSIGGTKALVAYFDATQLGP